MATIEQLALWAVALLCVAWGFWKRYYRWKNPQAPALVSGPVPWLGAAVAFGKGPPVRFLEETARSALGDCFTLHVAGRYLTFVLNPQYYEKFFNPDEALTGIDFAHATQPFLTRCFGVPAADYFASHLPDLAALRRRLSPARLPALAAALQGNLSSHVAALSLPAEGRLPRFRDFLQRASFAASVRALFGDALADSPLLYEHFLRFDDSFELASSDLPHFLLPSFTRAKAALLSALAAASPSWPPLPPQQQQEDPDALVASVVRGSRDHAQGASWALATLWASQANTMVSLFWLVIDLLSNPAFLSRARLQAQQALQKHGGLLSSAAVSEMPLLDAALRESLRLRSAPVILRATVRPVSLGPYVVPPGHFLCLSPLLSHRRHDLFPDPSSWAPERWLPPNDSQPLHRYAYISFGSGLYRCPGQSYAHLQLVLIAAFLLTTFDFQLLDPVPSASLDCLVGVQKPLNDVRVDYRRL